MRKRSIAAIAGPGPDVSYFPAFRRCCSAPNHWPAQAHRVSTLHSAENPNLLAYEYAAGKRTTALSSVSRLCHRNDNRVTSDPACLG